MPNPLEKWRIVGVSVTGSSHRASNRACEDAHAFRLLAPESFVAAVADGAGSASQAEAGAKCVTQTALEVAQAAFETDGLPYQEEQWHGLLRSILYAAKAKLEGLAAESIEFTLRDFATTLLVAIVTPSWIAVAQVGDGAIVLDTKNENLQVLTFPDHSEYLNETVFVTSENFLERAQLRVIVNKNAQNLALLTDGLQMLALNLNDNVAHAPFFEPLFRFAANPNATAAELNLRLETFLDSARVQNVTDDDKTLMLAVRL